MLLNQSLGCKKGSLLLEALLATTILSVSIVLIIQSLASSARASAYNINYSKALILLEDRLFDDLRNNRQELSALDQGSFETPHNDFRYRVAVKDMKVDQIKDLEEIAANVSWSMDSRNQQLQLVTYRFHPAKE